MTANAYTTPRAIARGQVTFAVAPEATYVAVKRRGDEGLPARKGSRFGYLALPPALSVRTGLAPDADIGFTLRSGFVPGVDVKYNFYRGGTFDLAARPGVQGFAFPDDGLRGWVHADLPLMVGARVGERLTLVASPGVAHAKNRRLDVGPRGYPSPGAAGRLGLGAQIALGDRFALFPEVTALRSLGGDRTLWVSGGLGLVFGRRPEGGAP